MSGAAPETSPLTHCPILHRDRFVVVVNKPAGILSHPNSGRSSGKEKCAFEGRYNLETKVFDGPAGRVWLIHRLDQDTSGVLLGALDEVTAKRCRDAFESGHVQKRYLALVRGSLSPEGTWLDHLGTSRERGRVRTAVLKGRPPNAELRYFLLGHNRDARVSLLDIELITGRTHQIRVQAASRQHPLIGDDVYGDFELNRRMKAAHQVRRLFLHARLLELKHPASGATLSVRAPLPDELARLCVKLGLNWPHE
jgi:RluA family pseudouridine synthase